MKNYSENHLSKIILGASIKVHRSLGPGLLESAYQKCLTYELQQRDLFIEPEKPLPVIYENVHIDVGYRTAVLVISEPKWFCISHRYLKDGFRRVVNKL